MITLRKYDLIGTMPRMNYKKVYLDTTIYIYVFDKNPSFIDCCIKLTENLKLHNTLIVGSSLIICELLGNDRLLQNKREYKKIKDSFFNIPNLDIIKMDEKIAEKAAYIKAKYDLKTPDAIHVATAIETKCDAFITNDKGIRCKEIKILQLSELNFSAT